MRCQLWSTQILNLCVCETSSRETEFSEIALTSPFYSRLPLRARVYLIYKKKPVEVDKLYTLP